MRLIKILFILTLIFQYQCTASNKDFDPYKILGLSRTADEKEIRQAYKKLAKHWHPDKNSDPDANERFTKINAAYEILSDSTKRQEYDEYGTTSQDRQYNYNSNHYRDPFDTFRAHFGEDFQSFFGSFNGGSNARKIINSRELLINILPNSDKKPYILYGWTTFCYSCRHSLSIFRGMEQQLNEVGIGTGEFNVNDQRISDELGVASAPALCIISQGRVYHFNGDTKGNSYSESSIKEFLRQSIPIGRHVQTLHNSNEILSFINSYNESNRIQALLVTKQKIPSLKFVLPCLQYLSRIQCAVLNSSVINQQQTLPFLRQISTYTDSVLLFKENQNPKVVLRENDVSYENIKQLFDDNQLLDLSVLTSKIILDKACEKNSNKRCFMIIGDRQLFEQSRSVLLKIAQSLLREHGTKMIYVDVSMNQQSGFNQIFSSIFRGTEKKLFILVARRWIEDSLEYVNTEIEFDESSVQKFQKNQVQMLADIEANLKLLIDARWQNAKKFRLPPIVDLDKRQKSAFHSIIDSIENKWNYWIERNPILRTLSSYFFTYQFWLFFLPILVYFIFSRQDSEDLTKLNAKNRKTHSEPAHATNEHQRERHAVTEIAEFNLELLQNYTRPGAANVIILVLIADGTNDPCIGHFNRQIASIKDSRMVFAILYRQRSSRWLNELYANIEADQNKPNFRCTSSTVLALYIRRKFFIPYWSLTNRQELSDESAAFLGMDQNQHRSSLTSSDDSINSSCDSLTFSDWIDLLFDGNFRNPISVTDWPTSFS